MIKVGITGGIGSGKTTVAHLFSEKGIPVFIADDVAKNILHQSEEVKDKIIKLFGKEAYQNQQLNRPYIAQLVFEDKDLLEKLNAIVHPAVRQAFNQWIEKQESPYVLYEAAIIFETESQHLFDYVILVTAPKDVRIERIKQRDHTDTKKIESRMQNQWSDHKKQKLADFIIKNINISETQEKVDFLHQFFTEKSAKS